jgi:tRNA-Thr(GGU) m(6)t(6)A37 methyltransferase TsaA
MTSPSFNLESIGVIHSPFQQKLGIPRQPRLAKSVESLIVLRPSLAKEEVLRGLDSFDYLWILYLCHKSDSWRETIRPPRLGGKKKLGVFATRSPHRPNPIGLSAVKIKAINPDYSISVLGADILDGTPLLDIKPYLPMWDAIEGSSNGWVDETPELQPINVEVAKQCQKDYDKLDQYTQDIIKETLRWDPRPAYSKDNGRDYTHTINHCDITWRKVDQSIQIISIHKQK